MKNVVVTGLNGTLAPVLKNVLERNGLNVVGWDRNLVDVHNADHAAAFITEQSIDAIFHLAMGDAKWAENLAKITKQHRIPMVFTSTAMVFDQEQNGPYCIEQNRNAKDDYGQGKIACEDMIMQYNSDAAILRIGWQIDLAAKGNNMIYALNQQQKEQGFVSASEAWIPATSFMQDTCSALLQIVQNQRTGVYHFDSNAIAGLNFAGLVKRLANKYALNWNIRKDNNYVHDQRLLESRLEIPCITKYL